MSYESDLIRVKQGSEFEKHVKHCLKSCIDEQILSIMSTMDMFTSVFGTNRTRLEKRRHSSFFTEIDGKNGDIHILKSGATICRISCKSTSGTTVSISSAHVSSMENSKIASYFAFAHVDKCGSPQGNIIFVHAREVAKIFDLNFKKTDEKEWIGLQHFLITETGIMGCQNFVNLIISTL